MTPRLASILCCCGLVIACSGCDLAYVMRVVTHGDSHTDDYSWKRTVRLAPAAAPAAWRESQGCANVAKLGGPAIGSFPIMTKSEWRGAPRSRRASYRFTRHL